MSQHSAHDRRRHPILQRILGAFGRAVMGIGFRVGGTRGLVAALDVLIWVSIRAARAIWLVRGLVLIAKLAWSLVCFVAAAAMITPLLLWPPLWPMLISAFDAARRDRDDDRDDDLRGTRA